MYRSLSLHHVATERQVKLAHCCPVLCWLLMEAMSSLDCNCQVDTHSGFSYVRYMKQRPFIMSVHIIAAVWQFSSTTSIVINSAKSNKKILSGVVLSFHV